MTEDARPIPDHLARELRALNDLELGALIADLGVDPLKPPGPKLRAALASIAEDGPDWGPTVSSPTAADHAAICLAKEPRRGRIAGGGAVDHARATWEGLARLGAAARGLLPDPDAVRARELWDAAGLTSVATWPNVVRAVAEGKAARDAVVRLGRDFGVSAEPLALPGVVADAAIAFSEELKRRPWGEAQEIGTMRAQLTAIRGFTGRADAVEGCELLADEVTARGAKLAAWRDFALSWTGVAADDAAQVGALRERLVALAKVRAVPGGRHAGELAPSSCPAAELPRRMGRIWDALVAEVKTARDASAPERLIASRDAALAREVDAVAELLRWRQWAAGIAPGSAELDNAGLRAAVGERVGASWRVNDLAGEAEQWARWAAGLVGDLPADEQRARLVSAAEAGRLATATAADLLELRKRLACPPGRSLLDHAAEIRGALGPCVPGVPETIALLRGSLAECQDRAAHLARVSDAAALACGGHVKGGDRERADSTIARLSELAARAGRPPTELRDELAGVKRERDNLRREVQQNRTRSAEVSAARRQTAEVNGELLDARDALKSAQGDLSGWRSWAMLAGRLPAVELIGARADDRKLRAAVDVMLRIASGAEDMAAELAKAQRARKSLEGRFAAAHEEGRLEAEALHKGRGLELDAWRQWARPYLASASAIVNDGGLRIELSRVLDAVKAIADELGARQVPAERLAGMVRKIREAAGPTTLSGPGALAEHVARLRDLAVRAALTADGAAQAGEALAALREIAEITGG